MRWISGPSVDRGPIERHIERHNGRRDPAYTTPVNLCPDIPVHRFSAYIGIIGELWDNRKNYGIMECTWPQNSPHFKFYFGKKFPKNSQKKFSKNFRKTFPKKTWKKLENFPKFMYTIYVKRRESSENIFLHPLSPKFEKLIKFMYNISMKSKEFTFLSFALLRVALLFKGGCAYCLRYTLTR